MFVGFTGNAFDIEKEFGLKKGSSEFVGDYEFLLTDITEEERPNHYAWISHLRLLDSQGNIVEDLYPEKRVYFHENPDINKRQPHSEIDIHSTMNLDIYSIFSAIDANGTAFLKIMINPLVKWVWIGGYVLVLGTMIALWPRKEL